MKLPEGTTPIGEPIVLLLQVILVEPADTARDEQQGLDSKERLHTMPATRCGAALALGTAKHIV